MTRENPWAYHEAHERERRSMERESLQVEALQRMNFEKGKERIRTRNHLDICGLRRRLETNHSLQGLRSDIQDALHEGIISRDLYDQLIEQVDREHQIRESAQTSLRYDPKNLPFSDTYFARSFWSTPLGQNIWSDLVWFLYAFCIQGSAIMLVLAWRSVFDFISLFLYGYQAIREKMTR